MVVTLYPNGQSAGIARVFVRHKLLSLGYEDLIEDACVIVSEMVTNVLKHVRPAGPFTLRVCGNAGRPLLEVWDPSARPPFKRESTDGEEAGRGLHIIEALSVRWDYRFIPAGDGGGKVVWVLLR